VLGYLGDNLARKKIDISNEFDGNAIFDVAEMVLFVCLLKRTANKWVAK